jgi:hypothetical protein
MRSVACDFFSFTYPFGAALVEVGTMLGGIGIEYITSVFFSGYFWVGNMGSWVGHYPLDASEVVFVRAYSFSTLPIRVAGKVEIGDP